MPFLEHTYKVCNWFNLPISGGMGPTNLYTQRILNEGVVGSAFRWPLCSNVKWELPNFPYIILPQNRYCFRASKLGTRKDRRVCSHEKVRTSFYLHVCTRHLQIYTSSESFQHMVRDDHIELVGVIYTQKSGEYHGVRQLHTKALNTTS